MSNQTADILQLVLSGHRGPLMKQGTPTCVTCGSTEMADSDFRDDLSRKEREISGMCQECQNQIFD